MIRDSGLLFLASLSDSPRCTGGRRHDSNTHLTRLQATQTRRDMTHTWDVSDVILPTTVTAAMLEIYCIAAV